MQRYEARHIANYLSRSLTIARNAQRSAAVVEIVFKQLRLFSDVPILSPYRMGALKTGLHISRAFSSNSKTESDQSRNIACDSITGDEILRPEGQRSVIEINGYLM